jgi:hypothetical protein
MWVVATSPNSLANSAASVGAGPDRYIAVLQGNVPQSANGVGLALNFGNPYTSPPAADLYFQASDWATAADRRWGPSSEHAGNIAIHVYADAHAQAIPADANPTAYLQFITRSGGEPVPHEALD